MCHWPPWRVRVPPVGGDLHHDPVPGCMNGTFMLKGGVTHLNLLMGRRMH